MLLDTPSRIRRVTVDLFTTSHLLTRAHAANLAVLVEDNLVHDLVQHVRAAVDGRQAREALGQFAQAVQWVQVGRFAVASQRFTVQPDSFDGFAAMLVFVTENQQIYVGN